MPDQLEICPDCGKPIGKLLKDCPNLCAGKLLVPEELESIKVYLGQGVSVSVRLQKRMAMTLDHDAAKVDGLLEILAGVRAERDRALGQLAAAHELLDAKPPETDDVKAERERCINVAVGYLQNEMTIGKAMGLVESLWDPETQGPMCGHCDGPLMRCLVMCTGELSEESEEGEPGDA